MIWRWGGEWVLFLPLGSGMEGEDGDRLLLQ